MAISDEVRQKFLDDHKGQAIKDDGFRLQAEPLTSSQIALRLREVEKKVEALDEILRAEIQSKK